MLTDIWPFKTFLSSLCWNMVSLWFKGKANSDIWSRFSYLFIFFQMDMLLCFGLLFSLIFGEQWVHHKGTLYDIDSWDGGTYDDDDRDQNANDQCIATRWSRRSLHSFFSFKTAILCKLPQKLFVWLISNCANFQLSPLPWLVGTVQCIYLPSPDTFLL